jgi:hypothetical protein
MSRTRRRHYRTSRKTLRDGHAHGWNWSTPSWWSSLFHTRPWRRKNRRCEWLVLHDPDAADGLIWPLDRKPHLYFW